MCGKKTLKCRYCLLYYRRSVVILSAVKKNRIYSLINSLFADELLLKNPSYWWYLNVKEFTNETTFHGVKYMFNGTKYILRK
jgi:hypothetical protein